MMFSHVDNGYAAMPGKLSFAPFGNVAVYAQSDHPSHVVLFFSGDGGWNSGVIDMARIAASMDALVLGIDFPKYQKAMAASKAKCAYPAADVENLSKFAQKTLGFTSYIRPVLVGYSSGATLVYALLVEAPPNSYQGVLSLGFCPDLTLGKPLCKGNGLTWTGPDKNQVYLFNAVKQTDAPWIVFQGMIDQVCAPQATIDFVNRVGNATVEELPHVGHGYSVMKNWVPQFRVSLKSLFSRKEPYKQDQGDLSDLPMEEVPAVTHDRKTLAVVISGDGGWASIDKEVSTGLSEKGFPVAGLNSLAYFWTKKTPETAARDLDRIINHYLTRWNKDNVWLIGYSFGADVLPFLVNRLPENTRSRVTGVALISPSHNADFEIKISSWLGNSSREPKYALLPELTKPEAYPVLCLAGDEEDDCLCRDHNLTGVKSVMLPGGHHLGGDYDRLVDTLVLGLEKKNDKL